MINVIFKAGEVKGQDTIYTTYYNYNMYMFFSEDMFNFFPFLFFTSNAIQFFAGFMPHIYA